MWGFESPPGHAKHSQSISICDKKFVSHFKLLGRKCIILIAKNSLFLAYVRIHKGKKYEETIIG